MRFLLFKTALIFCMSMSVPQFAAAQSNQGFLKDLEGLFQVKKKPSKKATAARARTASAQLYLNTLGFDAGKPDGVTGAKTRAAVSDYQQTNGFPVTGKLTKREYNGLKKKATRIIAANTPDPRKAQKVLKELGFYDGRIDGKWGPASQRALEAFRAANALATGEDLQADDIALLKDAATGGQNPAGVYDTVVLFGNEFSISEPFLEATELRWPDVKPYVFVALPQAGAIELGPDAAKSRIEQKSKDVSAAYQAQIDVLYSLMKPQIQTYAENTVAAGLVAGTVENFDIEIARFLMAGNGVGLIDFLGVTTPGIGGVIQLAQSTTHQLQALQAIDENTLSVVAVGLGTPLQKTDVETTAEAANTITTTDITAGASSDPGTQNQPQINGLTLSAEAANDGLIWPLEITISEYDPATGVFEGNLDWTSLNTVNSINGSVFGDGQMMFSEASAISAGFATVGCAFDLAAASGSADLLQGTYECDGQTGTASVSFPQGFDWAGLAPPPLTEETAPATQTTGPEYSDAANRLFEWCQSDPRRSHWAGECQCFRENADDYRARVVKGVAPDQKITSLTKQISGWEQTINQKNPPLTDQAAANFQRHIDNARQALAILENPDIAPDPYPVDYWVMMDADGICKG